MVILHISHFPLQWTVWGPFHLIPSFTFADMVDEELLYEHQLDKIAAWVNKFRTDGIQPESFLMPTFLKYFPVAMEPGVLTDIRWNNISGLFIQLPVLLMTYVDSDIIIAMSKQQVWDADMPKGYHP